MLARGGLVCVSARALAEAMPPAEARPEPIELRAGSEPRGPERGPISPPGVGGSAAGASSVGVEGLAESLGLAGYERVERVDDRGQFAVRGGLIDVFPTTGREPLRIEFFGDEIESVRAFSPFTQRALHPVIEATLYPAVERRLDLVEEWHGEDGERRPVPDDLVPPLDRVPDLVFRPDDVRRVWEDDGVWTPPSLDGAAELDPFPQGQELAFEAQRPAIAARGLAEAEGELAAFVRSGQRVVVAFPHRGEALRTQNLLRKVSARVLEPGEPLPAEPEVLLFLSYSNIYSILFGISMQFFAIIGFTYLMIMGEIDMSVGAMYGFGGALLGTLTLVSKIPFIPALLITLVITSALGFINGFLVVKFRLNSMMITIGMMSVVRGLTSILITSLGSRIFPTTYRNVIKFKIFGIHWSIIALILLVIILEILLYRTSTFRKMYYVGQNTSSARIYGIKSDKIKIITFILSSLLASFGGNPGDFTHHIRVQYDRRKT